MSEKLLIGLHFGMCVTNNYTYKLFVQLVLSKYCFIVEIFRKIRNNAIKEQIGKNEAAKSDLPPLD